MKGVLVGGTLKGLKSEDKDGERNEGFSSRALNTLTYVDPPFLRLRGGLSGSL